MYIVPQTKRRTDVSICPTILQCRIIRLCRGKLYYLSERSWIAHGEVSKNLPVDVKTLVVQPGNELGVGCSMQSGSSVNSGNPQLAKCSFLCFAVAVCILHSLVDVVFRDRIYFASRTPVAFRLRHNALTTAVGGNFTLRTRHSCSCPLFVTKCRTGFYRPTRSELFSYPCSIMLTAFCSCFDTRAPLRR
jgi:hypothetical protein